MTSHRLAIAVFLLVLLAGCGKKGPLYLPPDSPPATPSAPSS